MQNTSANSNHSRIYTTPGGRGGNFLANTFRARVLARSTFYFAR